MDFQNLLSDGATLAPEILLTLDGPKRDLAIQIEGNASPLKETLVDQLTEWNAVLDQ